MNLLEAIEERRTRIAELTAEVEQLEKARDLVEGILGAGRSFATFRTRGGGLHRATVRAESKPAKSTAPLLCRVCDKPMPPRPKGQVGRNKTAHPACRAQAKRERSTKAEPDPVPALSRITPAAIRQAAGALKASAEVSMMMVGGIVEKVGDRGAHAAPVNAVALANATKWQKQCPILHFENGKRCDLQHPHQGLHSAGGHVFATGLNPADLGGTSRAGGAR